VRRTTILLPPSEAKAVGGDDPPWAPGACSLTALDEARAAVLDALGGGTDGEPTMPAIERYAGVLYRELDWPSLPAAARRRGGRSLLIVSGLWGALEPADPIPYYKLKMSATLPGLGRLSTWWRPHLTAALAPRLEGGTVWDLLPTEHAAAWRPADVGCRRRFVARFVDAEGRTVSHWNKLLKGALVRHLLIDAVADPRDLAGWRHPAGYQLDLRASTLDADPAVVVFRERGRSARRPAFYPKSQSAATASRWS
jgi:cytoplasmic iron level regulating protein YaaA (DUF328/UPF0246 family)